MRPWKTRWNSEGDFFECFAITCTYVGRRFSIFFIDFQAFEFSANFHLPPIFDRPPGILGLPCQAVCHSAYVISITSITNMSSINFIKNKTPLAGGAGRSVQGERTTLHRLPAIIIFLFVLSMGQGNRLNAD